MKAILLLIAGIAVAFTGTAEARHHRRAAVPQQTQPGCSDPIMHPCIGMSVFSPSNERAKSDDRRAKGYIRTVSRETSRRRAARGGQRPRRMPDGLARVFREGAGRAAGVIRSASGATARVASSVSGKFQCLVDALDRQGYPIRFMGGIRAHGSVPGSLHPAGLALDVNQIARNRTTPRMPGNEVALANGCGLISGAQWANGDSGHFQSGGWAGSRRHYARHRHGHRYARHRHRSRYAGGA